MTQPNILELARQGDPQAIASVINYLLQPKHITAKVVFKDDCLQITLESSQVPEQESSVTFIRKLITRLELSAIKYVKISGQRSGETSVFWIDSLNFSSQNSKTEKHLNFLEKLKNGKSEFFSQIWPIWFPYPSSWLRAIVLVPIAFPGTRLIVFGFLGMLISVFSNSPLLLIFSVLFGLLIPTVFLAFVYHIFWFIWHKPKSYNKLPRWIPSLSSLWAGFYGTVVMALSFIIIIIIFSQLADLDCRSYYKLSESFSGCVGHLTGRATKEVFYSIENNNLLKQHWFVIWIITASYLYQLEILVKKRLTPRLKSAYNKLKNPGKKYSIDRTDLEFDRLGADMGLTQIKKGKKQHLPVLSISQSHKKSFIKLNNRILMIVLALLVSIGIYSLVNNIIKEKSKIYLPSQDLSPSPLATVITPQTDTFREAVNKAIKAANLTQLAKSPDEWKRVMSEWQEAIALMKNVPSSSQNYAIAQRKIIEYQKNLNYAQQNTVSNK
ncbi:hypothetical protein A6S26_00965 [Nostoc sp. ATCC 43529]|nr:hypothetical protein A6S26_00965 [Nostoc sp. ATCC 43529]